MRQAAHVDPLALHLRLGGGLAAAIAFLAAFEPNLVLRYGPFLAVAAFVLSNPHRYRIGATEWLLFAYVLWAGLSELWAWEPRAFGLTYLGLLSGAVMFAGVRAAIRWGRNVLIVAGAYIAGNVVGLATTSLGLLGVANVIRDPAGRITQVGDLNVNYVAYGAVAAVLIVVLLVQQGIASKRLRFAAIATAGLLAAGVVSTGTRGAMLAIAMLALWTLFSYLSAPLWLAVAAFIAAVVVVCTGWGDSLFSIFDSSDRTRAGLSGRLDLWDVARGAWSEAPLHGIGLGGIRDLTLNGLLTHNVFLEIGATLGLTGLAVWVGFMCGAATDRLGDLDLRTRRVRLGAILLTLLPILLSSGWDKTATAWVAIALLSQPLVSALRPSSAEEAHYLTSPPVSWTA